MGETQVMNATLQVPSRDLPSITEAHDMGVLYLDWTYLAVEAGILCWK